MSGFHVVHRGRAGSGEWLVKEAGAKKALCLTFKRAHAVRIGRALAKESRTSLRIHRVNGRLLEERSYGNETKRPG